MLRKVVIIILNCICLSFFMFPVGFYFLPEQVNTKMIMAVVGIIAFAIECLRGRSIFLSSTVLISAGFAMVFSIWCFFSTIANGTDDTTYSQYWLSFATWLGGAYGVCWLIRETEKKMDLDTLTFYLTLVCLLQCILALFIDGNPAFQRFVDSVFIQGQEFYHKVDRLYGIGAALDVAGVRFSVVLVLMAHQISANGHAINNPKLTVFYLVSFAVILIVGSIIARTTWVGAALGLIYMGGSYLRIEKGIVPSRQVTFWLIFLGVIIAVVLLSVWLYNTNPDFKASLRFGFEGFFNWAEKGTFRTDSTDRLNNSMWIWPTDSRTWTIGTGIFRNFAFGTDIGYCRFTLYCGLIGLSLFSLFFIFLGLSVIRLFPGSAVLSLLLISLTFIIWLKVATDIFFIYALLFSTASFQNELCTSSTT